MRHGIVDDILTHTTLRAHHRNHMALCAPGTTIRYSCTMDKRPVVDAGVDVDVDIALDADDNLYLAIGLLAFAILQCALLVWLLTKLVPGIGEETHLFENSFWQAIFRGIVLAMPHE